MSESHSFNQVDNVLIKKYFQKKCTDKEKEAFIRWITSLEHEPKLREILKDHWNEINLLHADREDPELNQIMGQLHRAINIQTLVNHQNQPILRKLYHHFIKVAAIIILPLIAFTSLYIANNRLNVFDKTETSFAEIVAPSTARIHIELPDGSTCWLNSESSIKFPNRFNSNERKILLNGEGYFDVFPDPAKPFIIETCNSRITALGTKFNILDNFQDKNVEVTLVSGKIQVDKIDINGKVKTLGVLSPNQQVVFSKVNEYAEVKSVVPDYYTAWINGKLVFRNDSMKNVIKKLSKWYNVDFEVENEEIEEIIFRATFVDETLSEVLKVLNLTLSINYIEHPREIQQDGTYSKKRITLFLN